MKNKIIAFITALGISLTVAVPAKAQWGYYGGWGYGGYGAALGITAGAALLGGVIGGAIANGGGYGYGYPAYGYAPYCGVTAVPYYDFYGNFVGYRRQTVC